jgi:diguanylate cyclase (GGDEF)-like protein
MSCHDLAHDIEAGQLGYLQSQWRRSITPTITPTIQQHLIQLPMSHLIQYSFLQAIAHCLASHPTSHQSPGAIPFMDLDDFKWINDSLGHWAGDQLLQLVAEQLQAQLPPEHLLAYFGGDEFAILLPTVPPGDGGKTCAIQLQTALSQPFNLGGVEAFARASIGITQIDPNFEPEALLRQAEIALYAAKQRDKSAYVWFSPDMDAQVVAHF